MATSDPGSGPGSLFGVSNRLQGKLNAFKEEIEGKKLEVRRVSEEMRSLIQRKEEAIIQELEDILKEVIERVERKKIVVQQKIQEIESKQKELEKILKELGQSGTKLTQIPEAIEKIKREMDIKIPFVKVTIQVNGLMVSIKNMYRCEQQNPTYNEDTRFQLKWSKCNYGQGNSQFDDPWGITINPMNENIYVADRTNCRIQIFSKEGEWIKSVEDKEMKYPENVLFLEQSIYVQCNGRILKLTKATEKKEMFKSYDFFISGICADNIHIYVAQWNGMKLMMLSLGLKEEKIISLKTELYNQDTEIRDISLHQDSFYILLSKTECPIQIFSKEGILTRCVIEKDSINDAYFFCLDQQLNIIVSDNGDSKVKIFSNEGKLIAQFGEKGTEKGQFTDLCGITVDEFGSIVTVDMKKSHMLQFFSTFY